MLGPLEEALYQKIYAERMEKSKQVSQQAPPSQAQGQGQGQGQSQGQLTMPDFSGTNGGNNMNAQQQYANLLAQSQSQLGQGAMDAQMLENMAKTVAASGQSMSEAQRRFLEDSRRQAAQQQQQSQQQQPQQQQQQQQQPQQKTPTMGPPGTTPSNAGGTTPQLSAGLLGPSSVAGIQAQALQNLQNLQAAGGAGGIEAQQQIIQQLQAGRYQQQQQQQQQQQWPGMSPAGLQSPYGAAQGHGHSPHQPGRDGERRMMGMNM